MKQGFINSFDNYKIYVYVWDKVEKPIGVVQIFHGMAEHAKRYENFAKFLNQKGFIVVADDHRVHGKTSKNLENLGKYELNTSIFEDTIKDELFLSEKIKKDYNLPLYVFGHSYGSFLCQRYLEVSKFYDKAIICGSALMKNRIDIVAGNLVAKITKLFKGKNAPAKLVAALSFGTYDKQVKTGSWLNTDNNEVEKYKKDGFCGKVLSTKFYVDFFNSFNKIYNKKQLQQINKEKPILIISGNDDPVGSMGKSVLKLFNFYKKLGLNANMILYKNARHEILNEPIKQQAYKDVLNFIKK